MKRLLACAGAFGLALGGGGALAADLPATTAPVAAPFVSPAIPTFTWTGFYAGVNLGVGFNAGDDRDRIVTVPPFGGFAGGTITYGRNRDDAVFTGGGHLGFNYQFQNNFVVGVETDLQFLGIDGDDMGVVALAGAFPPTFVPAQRGVTGVDWFGTLRLRAGYAFDRTLVYATGGLAYASGSATQVRLADGRSFLGSDDIAFGWTLGGGVEYAFTDNLILGVEGLWVSIDRDSGVSGFAGTFTPPGGVLTSVAAAGEDIDDRIEFGVVRARLSFKF